MADIVDDFLTRLQRHVPDLPLEKKLNLEREIRLELGGTRGGDIAKGIGGLGKQSRMSLVAHGLRQKKSLSESFGMASISRRTGYRFLSSRQSV